MKFRRTRVARLIVHHSGSPRTTTLKDIELWHKRDRGFEAIGYSFVIEGDGLTLRGRPVEYEGAHCLGCNHDSIGICVVGDNTQPEHTWSTGQIVSLRVLVAKLQDIFGPLVVCGHRDAKGGASATACPGISIQSVL